MTAGEMLVKLYDEIIKQLNLAIQSIEKKDYIITNNSLQKSQKIINYLKATLNFDYEISKNLDSLYDFFNTQIIKANIKKQVKPLKEILPLVQDLRDAFSQGEKLARINSK